MPSDSNGIYSLPAGYLAVTGTTILASQHNPPLEDIEAGLTARLMRSGVAPMTGPLKLADGTVGAPALTLSSQPTWGFYKTSTGIGVSIAGTKIAEFTPAGVAVGVTPASVAFSATARLLGRYTAAAGAGEEISLGSGLALAGGVLSAATSAGVQFINGTIAESHTGNAVTFALKTLAGSDPSSTDPVYMIFRNVTAATGDFVVRTVTGALSLTISSGSTMGFTSSVAGRVWIGALDNGGTPELFAINCLSGTNIYPFGQFPLITTTAEGGLGAADSAHVAYSASARTAKSYIVLGYASYESGLGTAGNWGSSPTRIQLYGPGVPLPGQRIQVAQTYTGAVATGSTAVPYDDSIPQSGEGDQYMSQAITPTSAANLLEIDWTAQLFSTSAGAGLAAFLLQDSNANALAVNAQYEAGNTNQSISGDWAMIAGTTSSTTFKIRGGHSGGATTTFNGDAGSRKYGGAYQSHLRIKEMMA